MQSPKQGGSPWWRLWGKDGAPASAPDVVPAAAEAAQIPKAPAAPASPARGLEDPAALPLPLPLPSPAPPPARADVVQAFMGWASERAELADGDWAPDYIRAYAASMAGSLASLDLAERSEALGVHGLSEQAFMGQWDRFGRAEVLSLGTLGGDRKAGLKKRRAVMDLAIAAAAQGQGSASAAWAADCHMRAWWAATPNGRPAMTPVDYVGWCLRDEDRARQVDCVFDMPGVAAYAEHWGPQSHWMIVCQTSAERMEDFPLGFKSANVALAIKAKMLAHGTLIGANMDADSFALEIGCLERSHAFDEWDSKSEGGAVGGQPAAKRALEACRPLCEALGRSMASYPKGRDLILGVAGAMRRSLGSLPGSEKAHGMSGELRLAAHSPWLAWIVASAAASSPKLAAMRDASGMAVAGLLNDALAQAQEASTMSSRLAFARQMALPIHERAVCALLESSAEGAACLLPRPDAVERAATPSIKAAAERSELRFATPDPFPESNPSPAAFRL